MKKSKVLIFDEATSALDEETAEGFAVTVNQLKGKVTMLFITHAAPKALGFDRVVRLGAALVMPATDGSSAGGTRLGHHREQPQDKSQAGGDYA